MKKNLVFVLFALAVIVFLVQFLKPYGILETLAFMTHDRSGPQFEQGIKYEKHISQTIHHDYNQRVRIYEL